MAFAAEHPVIAHSEFRPVGDIARTGGDFEVVSEYEPAGDQPQAIDDLERRLKAGEKDIVLLGATGTGKSATTAWLIERVQRPTLVMAPNKTLAAQLANELREMLPGNAVEYFVSYYDYYQPEAYIAQTDTYIEKDSSINDDVESIYRHINQMLRDGDFSEIEMVLTLRDQLFESIAEAIKSELSRINEARSNTKASMLYLTILTETKNMVLQSRNLLKSQQYFLKHRTGPQKWIK